ncbi:MAG: hypothetical protein L0J18_12970 [Tetragenococcus koreensis]|nr:hypothetical protein [Tetragenococcus koreensis]
MEITFYKDMEGYEKFVNNNEEDLENCIESGYISHISNVTMENVYEIVAQDILEQDIEDLTYLYNEVNEKRKSHKPNIGELVAFGSQLEEYFCIGGQLYVNKG